MVAPGTSSKPPVPSAAPRGWDKSSLTSENILWLKHWVNSWRSYRKRWANWTPSTKDQHGIRGSFGRTWTPYCMEGGAGRSCTWTNRGRQEGERQKLGSLGTGGKIIPTLQLCIYRVVLMTWWKASRKKFSHSLVGRHLSFELGLDQIISKNLFYPTLFYSTILH